MAPNNKSRFAPIDPVFRIPDVKIDEQYLVQRGLDKYSAFEADRAEWLEMRETLYLGWDDYKSPIRKGLWNGSSNFHLPTTEIQCNVMHARIMQAIFFLDQIFYIDPEGNVSSQRIGQIEAFMKYIVTKGSNYNRGIYNAIDDWAWDLTTEGMGILKRDWVIEQRRFIDIQRNLAFAQSKLELDKMLSGEIDAEEFSQMVKNFSDHEFEEVAKIRTVFNGSVVEAKDPSFVLFKGAVADATDLDRMETVIEVEYFTREQLLSFKESGFMDEDSIDAILDKPADINGTSFATNRFSGKISAQDSMTGINTTSPSSQEDKYEILKVYDTTKLSPKETYRDRVIYQIHPSSQKLCRWTYLDRVSANGKIPLHMGHLYRRPRRSIGRGMVETQAPFAEITDLLMNQQIDAGIYANQPMLKTTSGGDFEPGEFKIEAGTIVQVDNTERDLVPINFNTNSAWGVPLMNMIQSYATQLTSLGPQSTGQVAGRVGPLRSDAGLRTMIGQSDIQLDVIIRRVKEPISELIEGLYSDNTERMPDKMKITLLNTDGTPVVDQETGAPINMDLTREEMRTRVRFGLYANSNNMNKLAQEQRAQELLQASASPILTQSGIVSKENLAEVWNNWLVTKGFQNIYRFQTKVEKEAIMPFDQEIRMIISGQMPKIAMFDPEHQMKAEKLSEVLNMPEAEIEVQNGLVHPNALKIMAECVKIHEKYAEVMQKPMRLGNQSGNNNPTQQERTTGEPADAEAQPQEGGDGTGEQPTELSQNQQNNPAGGM